MNVCLMSTQSIHILKSVCIITTSFYLQNKVCVCDVMPFFLFLCVRFYVCAFLCVCVIPPLWSICWLRCQHLSAGRGEWAGP